MKNLANLITYIFFIAILSLIGKDVSADLNGLKGCDIGYTISKIRTAKSGEIGYMVARSYDGTLLGITSDDHILWKNTLSGYMNQGIWCADINGDGADEILMGTSTLSEWTMLDVDPQTGEQVLMEQAPLKSRIIGFGYRVLQSEVVTVDGKKQYFILLGSQIILLPMNMDGAKAEVLSCKYSFNDMWYNHENNSILMASAQSGGSCVHIINLNDPNWKQDYIALNPPGKIAEVLKNTANVRKNLQHFKAPEWERKPRPVYLMSESIPKSVAGLVDSIKTYWQSPVFLNGTGTNRAENWDRSSLQNEVYRNRCDARRKYDATSIEIVNSFVPRYEYSLGIAFCSGHGDDPYMFHLSTLKRILDASNGKKTGLIFPELEDHSYNFAFVMDDNFYPLADNCKDKNTWIYIRTMHTFWQANAYLPMWSKLLSGEYSNVFVPAMEETSDKSMELSLAARPGIWTSGATDSRGLVVPAIIAVSTECANTRTKCCPTIFCG